MFYKLMFVFAFVLAPINWTAAADLENEKIIDIYLNMTVGEAKETLIEQGYTEVRRERKVIIFAKGVYSVHVASDIVQSSDLTKPNTDHYLLTGISYLKNITDMVFAAEKSDVAFCEIVPPLIEKYCADEKTAQARKCKRDVSTQGGLHFNIRQKEGNNLSKGGFYYSAVYTEYPPHLCQVALLRKRSNDMRVKLEYMEKLHMLKPR